MVKLVGTKSNSSGIGARLVLAAGALVQTAEVRSGSSYLSQSDLRVHFGLGEHVRAERLTVYWPSGARQELTSVPANQQIEIVELADEP